MNPTLIGNRYRILRSLASGGFGDTFLAEDTHTPSARRCVIKQLKPVVDNPQMYQMVRERFGREAAILEQLGEANHQIPRLYAYFEEAGKFFLVQEFIEGQTLTQKLQSQGIQTESAVQEILVRILPVLAYVHSQQIVHRDIKPDNIILRQRDGLPVLIDFGSVKESLNTALNSGNSTPSIVVGTPGFMPAEQSSGRPIYSSDLYALGLTAIYLLTARIPQQLNSDSRTGELIWRQFAPNLSSSFAAVLDRAIRYHPQDRYHSAPEMLAALQSPTAGAPVAVAGSVPVSERETVAVSPGVQVQPQQGAVSSSNNWLKALVIGSSVGLVAALAVVSIRSALRSDPPTPTPPTATQPTAVKEPTPTPTQPTPTQPTPTQPAAVNSPTPTPTQPTPTQPAAINSPTPPFTPPTPTQPEPSNSPLPQNSEIVKSPNQNSTPTPESEARVPGFPPGTPETVISETYGSPTIVSDGLWGNTEAMLYTLVPNQIDLGFIVDRDTRKLRQTEASFAPSVDLEEMQKTVNGMAGGVLSDDIKQGLKQVQKGRWNEYNFSTGNWKGIIQRNEKNRIYIAIWEADLH